MKRPLLPALHSALVKPIVCSAWEVRGIIEGRITRLRRPALPNVPSPFVGVDVKFRVAERFLWPEQDNSRDLVCYAADYDSRRGALRELAVYRDGPTEWSKAGAMPPWASRVFFTVRTLEMAQVQSSVETAAQEGVVGKGGMFGLPRAEDFPSPAEAMAARWDAKYGAGAWAANGWTWAADIEVTQVLQGARPLPAGRGEAVHA